MINIGRNMLYVNTSEVRDILSLETSTGFKKQAASVKEGNQQEIKLQPRHVRYREKVGSEPTTNAVFWDMTQCGSCKNRRFGGTYLFHYHSEKNQQATN
jgi:hypothetical protein